MEWNKREEGNTSTLFIPDTKGSKLEKKIKVVMDKYTRT